MNTNNFIYNCFFKSILFQRGIYGKKKLIQNV